MLFLHGNITAILPALNAQRERKSSMLSAQEALLTVKRAQEGDQEAFAVLVEYFERDIRSYLFLHLGDCDEAYDMTQLVFLKAWLNLDTLHDTRCFRFWLFRIARHLLCDYWRRGRVRSQSWEDLALDGRMANLPGPEDNAERAELIHLALAALPSKHRHCLVLHAQGYSPVEIAERVGISSASVSTYVSTARRQFRTIYRQLESGCSSALLTV
jgi:RNA polymerase sigma-70 factor (ECF subfamily)